MRDEPTEISQGFLGSLRVAVPFPPSLKVEEGEGTTTRRVRLSTEHCLGFFINATPKLVTKLQATRDWLIQHFKTISKLSGGDVRLAIFD